MNDEGVVESIDAANTDDPNAHPLIREAVDGMTLAVDIGEWIFQATSQPATAEHFTPEGQVAKLVFERAVNWLRLGCVPIGVIDGKPPAEKLARLKQRYGGNYSHYNSYATVGKNGNGGRFKALGDVALRVFRLLGLPTVEAPGEVRRLVGERFYVKTDQHPGGAPRGERTREWHRRCLTLRAGWVIYELIILRSAPSALVFFFGFFWGFCHDRYNEKDGAACGCDPM